MEKSVDWQFDSYMQEIFQMKEVEKFCRFNLQYASMQSVIAGDADSHRFMKSTIHKAFPLKPSAKTRLVMAMTSSRWMRTVARKLHRLIKK